MPQKFDFKDTRAREALTHYEVLAYYDTCSLLEVKPTTGRTHQIRVHLAAIGNPLMGDLLYGHKKSSIMARHALHAYALEFVLNGVTYQFQQEPPDDFTSVVATCRYP